MILVSMGEHEESPRMSTVNEDLSKSRRNLVIAVDRIPDKLALSHPWRGPQTVAHPAKSIRMNRKCHGGGALPPLLKNRFRPAQG